MVWKSSKFPLSRIFLYLFLIFSFCMEYYHHTSPPTVTTVAGYLEICNKKGKTSSHWKFSEYAICLMYRFINRTIRIGESRGIRSGPCEPVALTSVLLTDQGLSHVTREHSGQYTHITPVTVSLSYCRKYNEYHSWPALLRVRVG